MEKPESYPPNVVRNEGDGLTFNNGILSGQEPWVLVGVGKGTRWGLERPLCPPQGPGSSTLARGAEWDGPLKTQRAVGPEEPGSGRMAKEGDSGAPSHFGVQRSLAPAQASCIFPF